MDLLVFEVDEHRFALPATSVREVVRAVTITRLPGAPRVVSGVINYRGTLVPVLHTRARFGLPLRALAVTDLLIIANAATRLVALHCDGGASFRNADASQMSADGDALSSSPFVAGLARFPDGTVVIHDLAAFLSEAESAELDHAMSAELIEAGV